MARRAAVRALRAAGALPAVPRPKRCLRHVVGSPRARGRRRHGGPCPEVRRSTLRRRRDGGAARRGRSQRHARSRGGARARPGRSRAPTGEGLRARRASRRGPRATIAAADRPLPAPGRSRAGAGRPATDRASCSPAGPRGGRLRSARGRPRRRRPHDRGDARRLRAGSARGGGTARRRGHLYARTAAMTPAPGGVALANDGATEACDDKPPARA